MSVKLNDRTKFLHGKKRKDIIESLHKYANTYFMLNTKICLTKENYQTKIELDMVRRY